MDHTLAEELPEFCIDKGLLFALGEGGGGEGLVFTGGRELKKETLDSLDNPLVRGDMVPGRYGWI